MSASTQFAQGDSLWQLKYKTLVRLIQMVPTATGDIQPKPGDSLWSLERKILSVLNQAPAI
jgi:hypothetical protein